MLGLFIRESPCQILDHYPPEYFDLAACSLVAWRHSLVEFWVIFKLFELIQIHIRIEILIMTKPEKSKLVIKRYTVFPSSFAYRVNRSYRLGKFSGKAIFDTILVGGTWYAILVQILSKGRCENSIFLTILSFTPFNYYQRLNAPCYCYCKLFRFPM